MVTEVDPRRRFEEGLEPYRISVEQFRKMIEAGVFPDQVRLELLGGFLFRTMTKNDPHNFVVGLLGAILNHLLGPAWFAQEEKSVVLGKFWRPEPDIAVVRGPRQQYRDRAPRAGDLGLLIEVSDVTYRKDRGVKWRRYAAVGIETYWIVNLALKQIEVYTDPSGKGKSAGYRTSQIYRSGDHVPVVLDGPEAGRIAVKDVLG